MPQLMERLGNVSQRLLELRFKEVLGRSPYQEILHARVGHAKRLLRSTRIPLDEVASQAGFSGPSVFSRHFRKLCQQTPSQYRGEHRHG
jgi:transcriptional regulator GlxA family with amidase domain